MSTAGILPADRTIGRRASSKISARTAALAGVGAVTLVHVWIISAGWWTWWPQYSCYYGMLADAFAHGQSSLRVEPAAELKELADPYDPAANRSIPHLHDASFYRGKYYLYWGPVPALLEAPIAVLSSHPIGDQYLVFAFVLGIVLVSSELILVIRARWFGNAPAWTVGLAVLMVGLASPIPFLLTRAAIYEVAIAGGQFFLLLGICIAASADVRRAIGWTRLLMIGSCWGLAIGSRASLAPAAAALTLLMIWRAFGPRLSPLPPGEGQGEGKPGEIFRSFPSPQPSSRGRGSRKATPLVKFLALVAPIAMVGVLLGAYNQIRFGSWREFGQRYQLAGVNLIKLEDHIFAKANVPPAAFSYLLRPPAVSARFPFIRAAGGPAMYPRFIHLPPDYEADEQIVGLLWSSPFLVFALAAGFLARAKRRIREGEPPGEPRLGGDGLAVPRNHLQGDPADRQERHWLALCLLTAAILGIAPVLFLIGCTMRYLADMTPALTLLAVVGFWQVLAELKDRPRWRGRVCAALVALAVVSIAVGFSLSLTGYYGHFHVHHPGYLGL